ncbi:hypothetical protein C0991_008033 [Blastosporella zonata]|nr:hypothetical protein C0991_008033 [Blastosporella zonata]
MLEKGWPTRKPPMLRLSLETSLESIPASPRTPLNHGRTMTIRHRRSSPLDGTPFDSPSHDKCAELNSPESSPTAVSFVIPSRATTRRRKMDRVRRLLGEEVPVRLVFPPSSGSDNDSDSGSEPSLTSGGKTSSDDDLSTPNTSPVSPTSPLFDVETPNAMEKPLPMIPRTPPRKKKIANARDSLVLPSSPLKSPRTSRTFVVPQASRPAPPPPKLPPVSPKTKSNFMMPQRNPIPAPYKTLSAKATSPKAFVSPQIYEHPPIVHHRSNSGGSARTRLGLGVILEEKAESEWYGSDDECDADYEFVRDDEVLGTVGGWGNGGAFLYHGPLGKGMGRGLARSYGKRVSGLA